MRIFPILALIGCLAAPGFAQEIVSDAPGTRDPAELRHIEGAFIIGYDQSGFDDMTAPLSAVTYDGPEQSVTIEGPRTRVIYLVPGDRSPLEVIRNYEAELAETGYEMQFTCGGQDCGPASQMSRFLYPLDGRLKTLGRISSSVFGMPRDGRVMFTITPTPMQDRAAAEAAALAVLAAYP